ncbi:hypothetical protein [Phenylobacterium sp. J367]|uniref:hypothetical protein n=1 Tax=Phenylobacterium sp. J367 TaxID=2898435 RepID=UPI0021517EC9|nr:hypothetical protein [Phenylobacterium sp. J367]MCR5877473.1 hypothetical protein [Phenylobacterium sp. J367]
MSLSPDHAALLSTYSQVAVGFAGFAGVIGAFSRFRMHAEATAFRVRAMVATALMEVLFALLPPLVGAFGLPEALVWRICDGVLAVAGTGLLVVMAWQASILYRVGRLMRNAAYVLCAVAVVLIVPLYVAACGLWDAQAAALYMAMLFFGMVLCAYHFLLLMVAVQLDDSEAVSGAAKPAKTRKKAQGA